MLFSIVCGGVHWATAVVERARRRSQLSDLAGILAEGNADSSICPKILSPTGL
jgi:hypothetical protein